MPARRAGWGATARTDPEENPLVRAEAQGQRDRAKRFRLRELPRHNLRTARAYLLKEDFQQFWENPVTQLGWQVPG